MDIQKHSNGSSSKGHKCNRNVKELLRHSLRDGFLPRSRPRAKSKKRSRWFLLPSQSNSSSLCFDKLFIPVFISEDQWLCNFHVLLRSPFPISFLGSKNTCQALPFNSSSNVFYCVLGLLSGWTGTISNCGNIWSSFLKTFFCLIKLFFPDGKCHSNSVMGRREHRLFHLEY